MAGKTRSEMEAERFSGEKRKRKKKGKKKQKTLHQANELCIALSVYVKK